MSSLIVVERALSEVRKTELGVARWPVWEKDVSRFPWTYDSSETCLLVAGEVVVTPVGGEPLTLRAGDLATFPAGMACEWNITRALRKHYRFG
ncbi:cupin domain-containing protein [Uliginosibacterium aquaticum]|uniref:Cupin domain-containing protein n=1 Tax=Uliginosibacterium aquaticum TaxID=2731212 RepID=A0ABX2IFJ6_9RHOO|nr:cupin domain-containing protein [Uliginosibacterium aquaticum]NSL55446.1 cupin domain-containing protein [Uliginosibacterium aquaticum]